MDNVEMMSMTGVGSMIGGGVGLMLEAGDQERAGALQLGSLLGLGAGILTASLDALENAYIITYARLALNGVPLTEPNLPLV